MVHITLEYKGDLRCEATHGPSGTTLSTDAPKDNMGKGESFSPTDLVATALAACMVTILGIAARREGLDIEGTTATVTKDMVHVPERRIGQLTARIRVPHRFPEDVRRRLEEAARGCPVARSLHPDIEVPLTFEWE